ncbi:uncharacterized protein [Haliotis cracherodii]|uniref:uncharacterized protein n=1 Tax=Haliotis cracherodii TaxID=6455 RepID=UPI0039E7A7CE
MSSRHNQDEKRLSKHLTVTSKCLAIVLEEREKCGDENSATLESTVSVHNGKELLEDFKLRNKTCYWNPALVESIRNLGYKGFVEPSTVLVVGNEIHLENLRTAWGRRLLKAPAGFTIERIGDVNGIEMQVIPQTQFIPLPDALCLIIMDLNNRRIVATLDTIKEKLVEWYREMTMPNDQLIFDTLGALIRERKVFHSGTGYFVVTPETYRLASDDQNVTFNTSWLPYHPMYIPVFPQIQNIPTQLQHLHHLQHIQHQQQQQLHMRAPMRSISCQADMNGQVHAHHNTADVGKDSSENKKANKQRPRSQSMRGLKTREKEKERNKATVNENDDALKRTMSVRYKTDKVKAINKDINLKTSNINQDKEKGEKEKISLFSKIFGRNKKKNVASPPPAVVKDVEYATFSAQFPPPEWHWYQQQVEKQRRTEAWVSQQVAKSCTLQYLQNMAPPDSSLNTVHYTEARLAVATHGSQAFSRPHSKQQENNNICDRKVHGRRHGTKSKKDKTNVNELNLRENEAVLFVHEETMPTVSLSPVPAVDDEIYQSVIGSKSAGPRHSTPRVYDTIPLHRDVGGYREHTLNNQDDLDQFSCHPHHQRRSHRPRRKWDHNSGSYYDNQHQSDISFEYKGRMPIKNSLCVQSRDSGVNCVGLSTNSKNNDHQGVHIATVQTPDPVMVRNKLDNLEEEAQTTGQEFVHLNNTMISEYQAELGQPSLYNNCYDSSMNEDNGGMRIVCEAEINHKLIPEIVLESEPHRVMSCQDVAEPASNGGSRDALNSEKSYDTVVAVKKCEDTSLSNDKKNSEIFSGDVCELSLVDSGFSSPRNVNTGALEPSKQSNNILEGCSDIKNHKQFMKTQPQVPHNSPKEKCPMNVEHRHKHSTHMLNNQRHSRGYKYDTGDSVPNRVSKDLHVFQQQQLSSKRFGLNGEFEVVGVV